MEQNVELESGPMDPMMLDQQGGVNQGTFDFECKHNVEVEEFFCHSILREINFS